MNLNDDFNDNFDDGAYDSAPGDQFLELGSAEGDYPEERRSRRSSGRSLGMPNLGALTSNPMALAAVAFALGLALGWFGIGWGVWPVEWTDAAAVDLRPDLREQWLRMTIDAYTLNQNTAAAQERLGSLEDTLPGLLQAVADDPQTQSRETILLFQTLENQGGQVVAPAATSPAGGDAPATGGTPPIGLIALSCLLTVMVGGALVFFFFRSRGSNRGMRARADGAPQTHAQAARRFSDNVEQTDFAALGQAAPVAQWMTTFLIGDDLFDDSFSIDAVAGEFLGECGLGIADTIGVGEPKRVTAFEVWLFDKNDIQTVTKVIMSSHVYNDHASRERLSAKGEPVLARPGAEAVLETETLQMVARVVDLAYGDGALPAESFFDRMTLELAVWQK